MGTFIILIVIVILALWGLKEYYVIKLGIGPHSSPKQVTNEIIALCKDLNGSGSLLDVGSGWGSVIMPLAKALPDWTFYGIEQSPTPWLVSQLRTIKDNAGNVNLFLGDAEKFRYRGYDIIFLNVHKKLLNEITPPLIRNIERGSAVITYRNQLDGIDAFRTLTVKDNRGMERQAYLYANVGQAQEPAPKTEKKTEEGPQGEKHIQEPVQSPDLELEEKPVPETDAASK